MPESMLRAMAKQAEAERERRAKIIHAEGEFNAAAKLVEAAALMATQPMTLQLRYLQTLTEIGVEKNTTIVFPLPMELMNLFNKTFTPDTAPGEEGLDRATLDTKPITICDDLHDADEQDREISLGTTTILGIFFALALLCAVFFGFGYSHGPALGTPSGQRRRGNDGARSNGSRPGNTANQSAAKQSAATAQTAIVPIDPPADAAQEQPTVPDPANKQ